MKKTYYAAKNTYKAKKRTFKKWLKRNRSQPVRDFEFIHINKTAGSSIEKALGVPFEHASALEKREELGRAEWQRRFTFSVVRNPWDKVVSHYAYRVKTNQHGMGNGSVSFSQWVDLCFEQKDPFYRDRELMFVSQCDWLTDNTGALLVDKVYRFEDLAGAFADLKKRLNLEVDLPHLKPSKRTVYQDYYDETSQAIIAKHFADDIKRFGYVFSTETKPSQ